MAADVAFDTMEEILIRLDVKDVIRCKSVCKPWYSLISTPYFAESHLKRACNNNKKIILHIGPISEFELAYTNRSFIVGSSNGLVCISPKDFQLLVVNPCTRQTMKILQPPLPESSQRWNVVWGFGYDSSNNDYKIVAGLQTKRPSIRFYVYSLRTCLWKPIKEIDYVYANWDSTLSGLLCDGVLHWFVKNWHNKMQVILSFNLSRGEFTETQQPDPKDHPLYKYGLFYCLGVMEKSLCIYRSKSAYGLPATKIWVLRSYSCGIQLWVPLPNNYVMNHDVAAYLLNKDDYYTYDDKPHLFNSGDYIGAPIFVPSLVSPHLNMDSSSKFSSNEVAISVEEKAAGTAKKNALMS